tara:strand:- start:998 stop:1204 length:207 start_codon:yes stop_codon:yes gene_type:complete
MTDQQTPPLTDVQFQVLTALIDLGIKSGGLAAVAQTGTELPGAIQAFSQLRPEQPEEKPEETEAPGDA